MRFKLSQSNIACHLLSKCQQTGNVSQNLTSLKILCQTILMRPKFQKRSALKFDGRIIPQAQPVGINDTFDLLKRSALKFDGRE